MSAPTQVDIWHAEAVIRVFGPWLAPGRVELGEWQQREVRELVARARRITGDPGAPPPGRSEPGAPPRTPSGEWR